MAVAIPYLIQILNGEQQILSALQAQATYLNTVIIRNLSAQILDGVGLELQQTFLLERMVSDIQSSVLKLSATLPPQIGSPQQANKPVKLPPTPPTGYGGLSGPATASAVWDHVFFTGRDAATSLITADALALNLGLPGVIFPSHNCALVYIQADWAFAFNRPGSYSHLDGLDTSTLLTFPSVLAWANAGDGLVGWAVGSTGYVEGDLTGSSENAHYIVALSEPEFQLLKAGAALSDLRTPPVWPGLANVTLGAPVVLADGITITGPLDGVIVKITAVPTPVGFFPFGARKSFVHVGGIVFIDDNAEAEEAQPLGLDDEVIVPRSIQHPVSAIIRLKSGVTGTITPWKVS